MKKHRLLFLFSLLIAFAFSLNFAISNGKMTEREKRAKVNRKIDNINYWVQMAEKGYIPFNAAVKAPKATFVGSKINALTSITEDSPDIPVTTENSTQSENSVFVSPNDENIVLNSNNSTPNPATGVFGANDLFTIDGGESWDGEIQGAGGGNSGDPTTAIGLNGRWFVNYIDGGSNDGGMGISYSDDQGASWTTVEIAPNPGQLADKNHMWIDNSPSSPYQGNIYVAWTDFGGSNNQDVVVSRSTDNGETWSGITNISSAANGSFNHGVNLTTGPNGEVYATWAIYDGSGLTESDLGFAKSLDGGVTWTASRAISNIRGIRDIGTSKDMRVNSFPVIDADRSNGSYSGNLYIVWTNIGVPGEEPGDMDIYIIVSEDQGASWETPIRVNQDEPGHEQFFPWITCDPDNGILSVIFYDDRNVGGNKLETFCANSDDAGQTWEDFKVSDVSFIPTPIPGLAGSYFGDYIGITANNGKVYPVWTDNRSGHALTYCSPYETNPLSKPYDLIANVTFETGECNLNWRYDTAENFLYFNVYRDDELLGTTTDTVYSDSLPAYNYYEYKITAYYGEDFGGESSGAKVDTQWGDAHIVTSEDSVYQKILVDSTETQSIMVHNTGQLDLNYTVHPVYQQTTGTTDYCEASGGGDEYISKVRFGDYINASSDDNYSDFTNLDWRMGLNDVYQLYVTNGNGYSDDQCGVWIDWDGNGEFDDEPVMVYGNPGTGPYMAAIVPPADAKVGSIRMRIRIRWSGDLLPCGDTDYGEVEDYSINIAWLSNTPSEGTIPPGDSALIDLDFMANGTQPGEYFANLNFESNDPQFAQKIIPVVMDVYKFYTTISASTQGFCAYEKDSVNLQATTEGTYDTLIYQWSSDTGIIETDSSSINVLPNVSTWYHITVSDTTGFSYADSILIEVYYPPVVDLGADSTICGQGGEELSLDAGNSGSTYLWSTGETEQAITLQEDAGSGIHSYWAEVTNGHGCVSSDTVAINFAALPIVNIGNDTAFCAQDGSDLILNAGNSGSTYLWSTGDTTQTFVVDTLMGYGNQSVSVEVTTADGCFSSDEIAVDLKNCTGIDNHNKTIEVAVYPNPGTGLFKIKLNAKDYQDVDIVVYDNQGRVVYQQNGLSFEGEKTFTLDITGNAAGIYQLFIKGARTIINKKLVIKN